MKEITALIRPSKVQDTKNALVAIGVPAFTGRKVFGRGKKNASMYEGKEVIARSNIVPNRMFIIAVDDKDVQKVIDTIILVNQTGHRGDGRIFVVPVCETYRISSGEKL